MDVSGDVPSPARVEGDLSQTDVQVPAPADGPRVDSWAVREENGVKSLVRIHNLPRLALFSPYRLTSCPISMDELTGKRVTVLRPVGGGDEVRIEDDISVQKSLLDRWIGETLMEMKSVERPTKVRKNVPKTGQKRRSEQEAKDL
jgi:hypothetical protein